MKKVRVQKARSWHSAQNKLLTRTPCPQTVTRLDSGESIRRGCGRSGLIPNEVGWKCFYCGNYVYQVSPTLDSLWFHFKVAREYWRATHRSGVNFINGVPVSGTADSLPRRLRSDLSEPRPPKWFAYYVACDEGQFQRYLETANG